MKRISNSERDTTFGQAMCTLRATLGLTQAEMAAMLGVSKRALGGWEAGSSYPKVERLKGLIDLGVKRKAFPAGHEGEVIRALWRAAHQKEFLDEQWLATVLGQQSPALSVTAPELQLIEETTSSSPLQVMGRPATSPRVDWGAALFVPNFYGREPEQAVLAQWVLQEHCRVVSLVGIGGIGKSALVVRLMHHMAADFEVVIFRALRDAPLCQELLDDCLQVLCPQALAALPASLRSRISLLLEQMRTRRVLLVLDNLEAILREGDVKGYLRPGFDDYEHLLRQIAEMEHQSCLLLTSREKLALLGPLEGSHSPVRSLRLGGLEIAACQQLLAEKGVVGTSQEQVHLSGAYGGNPLALLIVGETILDLFGGEIGTFLSEGVVVFGSITELLDQQFARLSGLEQMVLRWLAIVREPVTVDELLAFLVTSLLRAQVFEALHGLWRRSLIERGQRPGSFTLQAVVSEYVTAVLVEEAINEIGQRKLDHLFQHGLEQAHAKAYIRQTQDRLLIAPILVGLQSRLGGQTVVEERLLQLLDQLRALPDLAHGYGPANLVALLHILRGHLRGVDLSYLSLRGVYLQGIDMQDASLVGSILCDPTFTQAMDAIWSVAISRTGRYWAAGSWRGEVRVWCEEGQRLHLVWQAHTENASALTFSPDERTLATGSWDGTIKLWDMQSGSLLWTGLQGDGVPSLAFAPDGHTLASGGNNACVRLWDIPSGTHIQELESSGGVVSSVVWSPDGQWLAAGCFDGSIRFWQVQDGKAATPARTIVAHTHWAYALAFAPSSTQLVSGSWEIVKLWDVASGYLLQTLTGYTQGVLSVAWSPDGRTIASAGFDKKIYVWDVAENRCRAVLSGHTAVVYSIAFTPESSHLLSGSEDSTIRVWDVMTGQCVQTIEGYRVSFYDLTWSPDGRWLASAGPDQLVIIWDTTSQMQLRELHGHRWIVWGVAWSPDGRLLASGGLDYTIRVWEPATGSCLQVLRDPDYGDVLVCGVAWSPDGQLLVSGTFRHGLQMWDMRTSIRCWVDRQILGSIRDVEWSPDGTLVAGCGDNSICLWELSKGILLRRCQWQRGMLSIAWSPDGKWLACGGGSGGVGEVVVWDITCEDREKPVLVLSRLAGAVFAVAWSRSGKVLVSGDSEGDLCWWNVEQGECLRQCEGHRSAVQALKVSPDGRVLASSGHDSAIRLWDLESGELLHTLRRDRPYERLNITGIRGITEAQKSTLKALGAIEGGD
jgi:WD40 repeat protein/transcriptional regulator with XRE-family HTH domain